MERASFSAKMGITHEKSHFSSNKHEISCLLPLQNISRGGTYKLF